MCPGRSRGEWGVKMNSIMISMIAAALAGIGSIISANQARRLARQLKESTPHPERVEICGEDGDTLAVLRAPVNNEQLGDEITQLRGRNRIELRLEWPA